MIEDAIHDGHIAIIRSHATRENGDVVVAIVDGEDATLKRQAWEADQIAAGKRSDRAYFR